MAKKETDKTVTISGLTIQKAEALTEPNSVMLYGRAKTGKSTLAASISEVEGYERVLHIDLEKGSTAFARRYPNVDVVQIPYMDIDTFNNVIDELYSTELALQYDAVIVDTMSTAQEWAIMSFGHGGTKLDFEGWRKIGEWTMDTMWQLHYMRPLGISSYHLTDKQIQLTKEIWTLPKISGASQYSVANVPDIVTRLYIVDGNDGPMRVADFMPRESKIGGNRFDYLPQEPLGNISMPLLWEYIRDPKHADPEPAPKTAAERYEGVSADESN